MKAIVALSALCLATAVEAGEIPKFQVDAAWPKPLPNGWIMGQAAGVAVDAQDHIWVVQRPKTLTDDEKAATFNPLRTKCCEARPAGARVRRRKAISSRPGAARARATTGPQNEHGIHVDHKGFVWLAGERRAGRSHPQVHPRRQVRAADRQARPADEQHRTRRASGARPTWSLIGDVDLVRRRVDDHVGRAPEPRRVGALRLPARLPDLRHKLLAVAG